MTRRDQLMPVQFSLKTLFGFVVFVALGSAGLMKATEGWIAFWSGTAVALLLFAVLASIYSHGARRAFWLGFAICGWGYATLVSWPSSDVAFPLYEQLPTTVLLECAYEHHPYKPAESAPGNGGMGMFAVAPEDNLQTGAQEIEQSSIFGSRTIKLAGVAVLPDYFYAVGQWLWTLVIAWFGGHVAQFLQARSPRVKSDGNEIPGTSRNA